MTDEPDQEPEFGLVMPFVVCASQGGPFDDDAFVAGFRCGAVDAILANYCEPRYVFMSRQPELAQLDLIAMRHGFMIEHDVMDGEWFNVTFTRAATS